MRILNVPGLWNSGPEHWQTFWEAADPAFTRVAQSDWEHPVCDTWVAALDAEIRRSQEPAVLTAHSLGCALVAHWSRECGPGPVVGALLVAPSDVEAAWYPADAVGFAPMPLDQLRFRSIVVASTNDEYVDLARARTFASAWGSDLIELENAGHINGASGFGEWPFGLEVLARLTGERDA